MLTNLLLAVIFLLHQESFACPKGTIEGLTPDVCYLFSMTKSVWEDAETECISYGGHLASVGSAFENAFLQTQAKKAFSNDTNYYLGGSNVYAFKEFNGIKQWIWIDGAPFSYQNFAPGQQPKESNDEGYVYADIQSGQWYSDFDLNSTDTLRQYVCRLPNGRVDCNNGTYYYLNNKCYWSVGGQTFFEDTQSCQNNSGNLASIHNDLDNNIVTLYNSFKADYKDTFIGLHQVGENWVWQDGSPYNYSKWYDGVEPSSPKTECVMMEGEYWYGGGELECEIFPALCFSIDGICEKAVQVTPVKHVSEMRQEKKLRISREGLRRKHEKKFDTKKAQKC